MASKTTKPLRPADPAVLPPRPAPALRASGAFLPELGGDLTDWQGLRVSGLFGARVSAASPAAASAEIAPLAALRQACGLPASDGATEGLDPAALLGAEPPFVGRDAELERCFEPLRAALNDGGLRVVWLRGPAGVGKTRMCRELQTFLQAAKATYRWVDVGGADGTTPPALAGRVLLRLFGSDVRRRNDVAQAVMAQCEKWAGAEKSREITPLLSALLALRNPNSPAQLFELEPAQPRASELAAAIVARYARDLPLLVHVAVDGASLADAEALVRALRRVEVVESLAVILESELPPPDRLADTVIELKPLGLPVLTALAGAMLHRVRGVPEGTADALAAWANGSPLRLLQAVSDRVAAGELVRGATGWRWRMAEETSVTCTFAHATAAAGFGGVAFSRRLHALPADLRAVVCCAAVFGERGWLGGVLSLLRGARLDWADSRREADRAHLKGQMLQLQAAEIVTFLEVSRIEGDYEFRFLHPEDAVAAVAATGAGARKQLSRLAAQWLASRPVVDAVATPARIGELWAAGGDPAQAARSFFEAGTAARNTGQLPRALALFAAGCRCAGTDCAALGSDLRIALGGGAMRLSRLDDARRHLAEALHWARCLEDDERCGIAQLRLAQVARLQGNYDEALDFLDAANDHFGAVSAHRWVADVGDEVGNIHLSRASTEANKLALQYFLKALALRRRGTDKRAVARSLCHIARVHLARGHVRDAADAVREAEELGEQSKDRWVAAQVGVVAAETLMAQGEFRKACVAWDKAQRIAADLGDHRRQLEAALGKGEACALQGEIGLATAAMTEAPLLCRELDDPELWSAYYRVQASIALDQMELGMAGLDAERAVQLAERAGAGYALARARCVRACVLGTRVLAEGGARATAVDQECTRDFEASLQTLRSMGELVRYVQGLESYAHYLGKRGGGPRLHAVNRQLAAAQEELRAASGQPSG